MDRQLSRQLDWINKLEVNVAYPFLMEVYDDYQFNRIDKNTFIEVLELVQSFTWRRFVIGLPINMDGSEGPRCQSIRQFQKNLEEYFDLPMCFWDERLSTVAVTRAMLDADTSRAKRAKAVDKMAAAYILQGALDAMR